MSYGDRTNLVFECCLKCTPETGRTACGPDGRNCHSYCERYLAAKNAAIEQSLAMNKERRKEGLIRSYEKKCKIKTMRRHGIKV